MSGSLGKGDLLHGVYQYYDIVRINFLRGGGYCTNVINFVNFIVLHNLCGPGLIHVVIIMYAY